MRRFVTAAWRARTSCSAVAIALAAMPYGVLAQDADLPASQPEETALDADVIVVTAQKRSERLIEVPIAVTAVSGETLADAQINDTESLVRAVPSLSYQQGNNPNNSAFRIRGVGSQLFGQAVESAVSIVVDGVVVARSSQGFTDLADIERVEVLRGPQGTLFGKNATGGVINIVTAAPEDYFTGSIDATIAEGNEYRLKGSVTGPIADGLNARISGFYNDVGGHLRNIATDEDVNGFESWGLRGKLQWDNGSPLTAMFIAEYRETDANCCSRVPVRIETPAIQTLLGDIVASPTNREVSNDNASYSNSKVKSASLQLDYDVGPATITSITAWQNYEIATQFEPDQIFSDPVRYVGPFPYSQWNSNVADTYYDSYTQEVRIASNGGTPLNYVLGAFFAKLDMDRSLRRRLIQCPTGTTIGALCDVPVRYRSSGFDANFQSDSAAAFGELDYNIFGGLHLIGGLRLTYEKQTVEGEAIAPLVPGDLIFAADPNSGRDSRSDTALTGKAGFRYELNSDANVYGTYTRGYKSFALDATPNTDFSDNPGLEPEHVNSYEVGVKYRTFDGALNLAFAAFRTDFTNLQVQALDTGGGNLQVRQLNAGKSRSQGFELEATLRPTTWFTLPIAFTYVDAKVNVAGQTCARQDQASAPIFTDNFPSNICYRASRVIDGNTVVSDPIIDVVDGNLPSTPSYRINLSPRVQFPLSNAWDGFILSNVNFQSEQTFALEQDPLLVQSSYTIVDLSIGVESKNLKIAGFVKNLFDTNYYSQLSHGTILSNANNPFDLWANIPKDADRYFGLSVGYRY